MTPPNDDRSSGRDKGSDVWTPKDYTLLITYLHLTKANTLYMYVYLYKNIHVIKCMSSYMSFDKGPQGRNPLPIKVKMIQQSYKK